MEIQALHDSGRGSLITYADVSLNNHIRNMIASRRTQKRGGSSVQDQDDGRTSKRIVRSLLRTIDGEDDPDEPGEEFDFQATALKIDVRRALRKLRPELRDTAVRLIDEGGTDIAEATKVSRNTVYERIKKIRRIFTELGLEEYLR